MKTMMSESMKKEFGRAMRGIALVGVIAGACPPGAWAQQAEAPGALERRVDAAFEAAFPLYEMARARFNAMVNPLNPAPSPVNGTPVNRRNLIDHTARDVTTPNNDTLYSATWLDLHATPVRIRVPRVEGGRYWSVALLDIFTNNFAILGRQQDGEGVRVEPLDRAAKTLPQWVPVRTSTDPENFLAVVNEMLSRNPLPATEVSAFSNWADLGVGGGAFAFNRTSAAVQAAWHARLPALHQGLREGLQRGAKKVDGWSVPSPDVGDFGQNHSHLSQP